MYFYKIRRLLTEVPGGHKLNTVEEQQGNIRKN